MADVAVLSLQVNASQVPQAVQELDKLTAAGTRAEASTKKLGASTATSATQASRATAQASASVQANAAAHANAARAAQVNATANTRVAVGGVAAAEALLTEMRAANASATALLASAKAADTKSAADARVAAQCAKAAAGLFGLSTQTRALTSVIAGGLPAIAGMASALLPLLIGSAVISGVLAGMKAIGDAWNRMGEDARQAKQRTADAIAELEKLAEADRIARLGGPERAAVAEARGGADGLEAKAAEIARLEAAIRTASAPAGTSKRLQQLRAEYSALLALVEDREQRITLVEQEAARERARQGREADAARQRQVREGLAIAERTAKESADRQAEAFAKLQREIDPAEVWAGGVAAGIRAIESLRAEAEKLELAAPLERGVKAAQEMRAEAAKLREELAAVQAAMPEGLRSALGTPVARRAAPTQAEFLRDNFSRNTPRPTAGPLSGFNSAQASRERQDAVDAINNAHKSGISRGFDAARDKVSAIFQNAFSAENLGQAATGFALNFAAQAASRLVDGVRALFGESESERLAKQNVEAMDRLRASIEEWGNKVAQLSTTDVTRFSAFAGASQRFSVDERGPRLTGGAERQARDLEAFFGFDFGESINPDEWNQLLQAWNRAFAEAQRIVNEQLNQEIARRRAVLSGDSGAVAAIDAGAARDAELRRASDLLSKGYIDQARFMELAALAQQEYEAAIARVARAAEEAAAAEAERQRQLDTDRNRQTNSFLADIARWGGDEAGARAIERAQQRFEIVERWGEEMGKLFDRWIEGQDAFEAQAKANQEAAESAQRAAQATQDFARAAQDFADLNSDFKARRLALSGDDRGAFVEREGARAAEEARRVEQRLRDQGLSGIELQLALRPFLEVIAGEFNKKLADFDARAAENAQAASAAIPRSTDAADAASINAKVAQQGTMAFVGASSAQVASDYAVQRSQLAALRHIEQYTRQMATGTFGVAAPSFTSDVAAQTARAQTVVTVRFGDIVIEGNVSAEALPQIKNQITAAVTDVLMGSAFGQAERAGGSSAV